MGEGRADTAAIQIHHLSVLATGEDNTPVEGIAALRVDEADTLQRLQGITLVGEMTPQISAVSVADAEFFNQSRLVHSALFEIP